MAKYIPPQSLVRQPGPNTKPYINILVSNHTDYKQNQQSSIDVSWHRNILLHFRRILHRFSICTIKFVYIQNIVQTSVNYHNPRDLRTVLSAISLNFFLSSLHVLAASTFAALSSLGSTEKKNNMIIYLLRWTNISLDT